LVTLAFAGRITAGTKSTTNPNARGDTMLKIATIIASLVVMAVNIAYAANTSCIDTAAEKKLSGAAKTSFINKCVQDGCASSAAEKKLAGAAKDSFTKKCVADGLQPYCEQQSANERLSSCVSRSWMTTLQSVVTASSSTASNQQDMSPEPFATKS